MREYTRECHFRESLADVFAVYGNDGAAALQPVATLTFKPEAVVGRKIRPALEYMSDHGFRAVVARAVRFSRHMLREMWRYQWNVATLDRLAIMDAMHRCTPSLWVAFVDTERPLQIPGTVRFRALKGSSLPHLRDGDTLRSYLGEAEDRMITFLHGADEPIDIIRELGIMFDSQERARLLQTVAVGMSSNRHSSEQVGQEVQYVESGTTPIDINYKAAKARLLDSLNRVVRSASKDYALLIESLRSTCEHAPLSWRLFAHLEATIPGVDPWDVLQVAARLCPHDLEGTPLTIDDDGRPGWLRGEGEMVAAMA